MRVVCIYGLGNVVFVKCCVFIGVVVLCVIIGLLCHVRYVCFLVSLSWSLCFIFAECMFRLCLVFELFCGCSVCVCEASRCMCLNDASCVLFVMCCFL